jgi:hypothetical protein
MELGLQIDTLLCNDPFVHACAYIYYVVRSRCSAILQVIHTGITQKETKTQSLSFF